RLRITTGQFHCALLHDRHSLERQLDAQVATGDHDAVEGIDDLFERVDSLRLLDLRDDGDLDAFFCHDLVHTLDIAGVTHEGQRDQVCADVQAPTKICLVLFAERGNVDSDTGQVDALVVGNRTSDDHLGGHNRAIGLDDLD